MYKRQQHYRDAKITQIYEGTNGIQAMDLVGRKLPIRLGGAVGDLLGEMAGLDAELGAPELASIRAGLADAVAALKEATDWLLANGLQDPVDALAGATPYLRLFGIVTGGWLLARSAVAACELSAGGDADPRLVDKVAVARFYAEQLLPAARGLVPAVTAGAADLFAIPEDRL